MTTVMRAVAHADRQHQEHLHLEAALNCLVNGLVAKGFTFVTLEATPQQMQERLAKFDEGRTRLGNKLFGFLISGGDMPDFAKTISKRVMAFGVERFDDA